MMREQKDQVNLANKLSIKVLIADDDLPTRMLLRAAISQWGYDVVEANDGEQAWELINQADPPMLLVLDWLMPKMDGIVLSARIKKELDFQPYIILLTQITGTSNIIKALEAGADEFLSKPFNMTELRSRLNVGAKIIGYKNILAEKTQQLQQCVANIDSLAAKRANKIIQHSEFIMMLGSLVLRMMQEINLSLDNVFSNIETKNKESNETHGQSINLIKMQELNADLHHIIDLFKLFQKNAESEQISEKSQVNDIVNQAIQACHSGLSKIKIEYTPSGDLPKIEINPYHLLQAFIGLIINGIELLKAEIDGILKITTKYIKNENLIQVVILCHINNTTSNKPQPIFKPLWSYNNTDDTEIKLSITTIQNIIQQLGGALRLETNDNQCLQFTVDLPILKGKI